MKRILLFLLAFLAIATVLLGSILLVNRSAFRTLFENREGMMEGREWVQDTYSLRGLVDYVENNPERVTILSRVVDAPDSLLVLNPDVPRPMGTLSNLFVLMAVADAFETGALDPGEPVEWERVTAWQIPQVSEQNHVALGDLIREGGGWEESGLENGDGKEAAGGANDGAERTPMEGLTLERATALLAQHGDLALADYLLDRVGRDEVARVMREAGLRQTQVPAPFSGLYLLASWRYGGSLSDALDGAYGAVATSGEADGGDDLLEWATRLGTDYASGSDQAMQWRRTMQKERLGLSFMQERDALGLFPMASGRELLELLERLWRGVAMEPGANEKVLNWLSWPSRESAIRRDFTRYGALYDSRMGLLGGLDIGTSRYTGQTTVQVVLFDRLPVAFWFHLSANHMHQDFQQRLIYDPALIQTTANAIERTRRGATAADPSAPSRPSADPGEAPTGESRTFTSP